MFNAIDQQVRELRGGQLVHYREHLRDNYYVSMSTGYASRLCGFQKILQAAWMSRIYNYKPTKHGLALRLDEWQQLEPIRNSINSLHNFDN